jgi:hypothetical protein
MLTAPSRTVSIRMRLACSAYWSLFAWLGAIATDGLAKKLLVAALILVAAVGVLSIRIDLRSLEDDSLEVQGLVRKRRVRLVEVDSLGPAFPNPLLFGIPMESLKLTLKNRSVLYLPSILYSSHKLPPSDVESFIGGLAARGVKIAHRLKDH